MTTKILALTDALGNLVRFVLLPGQRFDTVGVAPLIKDIEFGGFIADRVGDHHAVVLRPCDNCDVLVGAFPLSIGPEVVEELQQSGAVPIFRGISHEVGEMQIDNSESGDGYYH